MEAFHRGILVGQNGFRKQGFALAESKTWHRVYGFGVIAQLVERLNGIEEVWGSNPHGSIAHYRLYLCPEIRFD